MESSANKKYYLFSLSGVILMCIYLVSLGIHSLRFIASFRLPIHAVLRSFALPFVFQVLITTILIFIFVNVSKNKNDEGVLHQYKALNLVTFIVGLFVIVPSINRFIFMAIRHGYGPGFGYVLAQQLYILYFVLTIGTNFLFKSRIIHKSFFVLSLVSFFLHLILIHLHINIKFFIDNSDNLMHLLMLVIHAISLICFYISNNWFFSSNREH